MFSVTTEHILGESKLHYKSRPSSMTQTQNTFQYDRDTKGQSHTKASTIVIIKNENHKNEYFDIKGNVNYTSVLPQ